MSIEGRVHISYILFNSLILLHMDEYFHSQGRTDPQTTVARENEINLSSKETTSGTAKSEIKKTGRSRGKSCMFFSEDVSES